MSTQKITDASGAPLYEVTIDDSTHTISKVEKDASAPADLAVDTALLNDLMKGTDANQVKSWDLDTIIKNLGQTPMGTDDKVDKDKGVKHLQDLSDAISQLKGKIAAEQKKAGGPDQAKLALLKGTLKTAESSLDHLYTSLKSVPDLSATQKETLSNIAAQHDLEDAPAAGGGKAQITSNQTQQQGTSTQQGGVPQQGYPGYGKAQTLPGGGGINLNTLLQSSMFQTMNINSMDQLGKTQQDQQKMMMLFMYFASMAMSGDIGAMTAFMQFITTIITKDKSQLNVNMASKMIELEDANRKAVDQLLNTPSYDPNNPQVAADFSKTMEKTKADEGSIATSQKLIAQMMEDFGQVSEFLNNLQKSLLDIRGRVLSRNSTFNG